MREEHEKKQGSELSNVSLHPVLKSLDRLLRTIEDIRLSHAPRSEQLLKSSVEMSKDIMMKLVKHRCDSLRDTLLQTDLPYGSLLKKLVADCDATFTPLSSSVQAFNPESDESRLARLINTFAEAADGPDRQVALVALIEFKSTVDAQFFQAHMSNLSPQFRAHILDLIDKASKENTAGATIASQRKEGQEQRNEMPAVVNQSASLRARLEALR